MPARSVFRIGPLYSAITSDCCLPNGERAFTDGLVVAMDVKDSPENGPKDLFVRDEFLAHFAVPALAAQQRKLRCRYTPAELWGDDELIGRHWSANELDIEIITQDIIEHDNDWNAFYRFVGDELPATFETARNLFAQFAFFMADYVWLRGEFLDVWHPESLEEY